MRTILTDDERRVLMGRYGSSATPDENNDYMTGDYPLVCAAEAATLAKLATMPADELLKTEIMQPGRWVYSKPCPFVIESPQPIDMILHCPACGMQHIDAPEWVDDSIPLHAMAEVLGDRWDNPPHHSHLCHGCGHIWRPADVPTNGVAAIKTKGKADSPVPEAPTHPFKEWFGGAETARPYCAACGKTRAEHAATEAPAPAVVQVPQGEYQRNVMSSLANWLETRSHTIWAQKGGHDGLMQIYAADLRAMLATAPEAPAQAEAQDKRYTSGGVLVPNDIAWGIVGSTGHGRKKAVDALHALLKAAPEAPARECGLCGSDTPFTGSCGGGRENPRALCFATPERFCEECSGINGHRDFKCSRYVAPEAATLPAEVREALNLAQEALEVCQPRNASAVGKRGAALRALAQIDALGVTR